MLALTATALVTTAAAVSDDALRHLRFGASVEQIPLLATIFLGLAWQANRRMAARDRARIAAEAQRLLLLQRQFLQDASHQLRTPDHDRARPRRAAGWRAGRTDSSATSTSSSASLSG